MRIEQFDVVDLLCGAGGGTQGVHVSDYGTVIEGLNHSETAIAINKENHGYVDFRIADLYSCTELKKCDLVIAGVECTNHSNAKGGVSRKADSRAMANELLRVATITECSVIVVENVIEFKKWGPLIPKRDDNGVVVKIKKGKDKGKPVMVPDPKKAGNLYHKWKYKMMHEAGFVNCSERVLCAADYGAPTSRKRLFLIFAKEGWNVSWPEPTHSKEGKGGLFGLPKWKACGDYIDLNDKGSSIFGRKRPLVDNTLKRIAYGIKKYVLNSKSEFMIKYYGNGNNVSSTDLPLATITTKDRHAIISTQSFYSQHYHGSLSTGSFEEPLKTIVTKDEKMKVDIEILSFVKDHVFNQKESDLIMSEFNRKSAIRSSSEPIATITTFQGKRLIKANFMHSSYTRKTPTVRSVNEPLRTITTFQSPQLVTLEMIQFVCDHLEVDDLHLIECDGEYAVHVGKGLYLKDIYMRWLTPKELAVCQGFPSDYKMVGNKASQIKGIGNSIPPPLITAIVNELGKNNQNKLRQKRNYGTRI